MGFFVYVLKSQSSSRSYVGHSKDLSKRVFEHNCNKNKSTRGKGPWKLVYSEEYETRSDASKREQHFKTVEGRIELKEKGIL